MTECQVVVFSLLTLRTEIAGNIIPAIATTNAIIAGLIVLQALHLLRRQFALASGEVAEAPTKVLRNVNIQTKTAVPLGASRLGPPNENCSVCRDTYTRVRCDPKQTTLGEVVKGVLGFTGEREVSVFEGNRLLADPDFDDNNEKTLEELGIRRGQWLTINDEDGDWDGLSVAILDLPYVLFLRSS